LLLECGRLVETRKGENGPSSWCFGFDEDKQAFFVEALFAGQEAVAFHQSNIAATVKQFAALMAKPPETSVRFVDWSC
jgi:hypothetical protein